ncbi:MAG: SDR family oxidoreductase [Deltaproteobacteria bacterium]|nr:SDR family oxidoreductase [Deltaproteobacteria bacterium]
MHKFLVTGGAGFIGSNLCERLVKEGNRVRLLDNLSTGKEENLKDFIDDVEFIRGDLRDLSVVEKAVKGVEYLIHLGALGSVPRSVEDPSTTHEVNVTGTLNVLLAARNAHVKRVVYASSSSVYGNTPVLPKREEMLPTPLSPYAVSKLSGEYYCQVFYKVYGLETVAMRYFNVFGKRQDPNSQYAAVIPRFITSLMKNERPTIYGDGEQTRDFTFVEDCNQANIKACFAGNCPGLSFNVGYGSRHSINEVYEKINKWVGSDVKPLYAPPREGDVRHSLASLERNKKILSFEPEFNINTGFERTVKWYLQKS